MHDPQTVAHEIPNYLLPAKRYGTDDAYSYRRPFITVWHVDPETDGTDDSCGWFAPNLTKDELNRLRWLAKEEAREPWFQAHGGEKIDDPVLANALMDGAITAVALVLHRDVSPDYVVQMRNRLIHNSADNVRRLLAYKTGYHGNSADDDYWREEHAMSLFTVVSKNILKDQRPWYRHPRWHVHHWKLQIHPVQHFKRWTFSRCCRCGGRFPWAYSPMSKSWYGGGPRWFRSEKDVYHHDCERPADSGAQSAA